MPREYNKTKKSFIFNLPIECLPYIDAFKNKSGEPKKKVVILKDGRKRTH